VLHGEAHGSVGVLMSAREPLMLVRELCCPLRVDLNPLKNKSTRS